MLPTQTVPAGSDSPREKENDKCILHIQELCPGGVATRRRLLVVLGGQVAPRLIRMDLIHTDLPMKGSVMVVVAAIGATVVGAALVSDGRCASLPTSWSL